MKRNNPGDNKTSRPLAARSADNDAGHRSHVRSGPRRDADGGFSAGPPAAGRGQVAETAGLIRAALEYRRRMKVPQGVFRLFNRAGDGDPALAIDIYGDFAAISWYSADGPRRRDEAVRTLESLKLARGIYEIDRFRSAEKAQSYRHIWGENAPEFFEIAEGGAKFLASFSHGQNAGFFIDNRNNRSLIAKAARGARVLNLFSYTGALSVVAGLSGAIDVATVDVSKNYNSWARENLLRNGLSRLAERVFAFDAADYLKFCAKKGYFFDLIILDPPSYAASLDGKAFSSRRNYGDLFSLSLGALAPGGSVLAICNTADLGRAEFCEILEVAMVSAGRKFRIGNGPQMPFDFVGPQAGRSENYLKTFMVTAN